MQMYVYFFHIQAIVNIKNLKHMKHKLQINSRATLID